MRRTEPACSRCGNEQDLAHWCDGKVYCIPCLTCSHGAMTTTTVCMPCVRALYSIWTFQGHRIVDMEVYIRDAWRDYGITPDDLAGYIYKDVEFLVEHGDECVAKEPPHGAGWCVVLPPPHHRLTSSGGSR